MPPAGRVLVAFDDPSLVWSPTWTRLDDAYPNLVTSYTIDRGRQFELDRTDTGRATVEIADVDGVLDPTNPAGPFYGKLEPLLQIMLGRHNPVTNTWYTRFRGWIDEFDYAFDPSQQVNRLTVQCVDIFEILAAIEMQPGEFGDQPPANTQQPDAIYFHRADETDLRMLQVLGDAGIPVDYHDLFSGNVKLFETVYSAGENILTVIQEAADAEFPGAPSNVYTDRLGRLVFHGRLARFFPVEHSGGTTGWDYTEWQAGDGEAVAGDPTGTVHLREFAFDRGLAKVINVATATPLWSNAGDVDKLGVPPTAAEVKGQLVKDTTSIGKYGIRSWSAQNLLTRESNLDGSNSLVETKRFASYYVDNYKDPKNRVNTIGFRSMRPGQPGASILWQMLSRLDIADTVLVTVSAPGGGAFVEEPYYVEGVHEEAHPLGTDAYDDVTLRLDLSPRHYYDSNPWP